jgi:collagen type III alpha
MGRFVNGITRPASTFLTNGPTPNGIVTGMHGHPQLQPGVSFSVGPPLSSTQSQQPNGAPGGPQQPPLPPGGVNPGNQQMPFNSLMPGQPQQQRPPLLNGHSQQPQQRGPANNGPFQSPTMQHSPQNNAGTPGHSGQPGPSNQPQQGQQPPIGQFGGPSPNMAHMSRTEMLPPNGGLPAMNPMVSGQQPQQPGGPPTLGYPQQQQQGGRRPPSRTNTPMMQSSPSLASRQPPVGGAVSDINAEVMGIPQMILHSLKRDIGLGDKELATLTNADKVRSLSPLCLDFLSISYYISSLRRLHKARFPT